MASELVKAAAQLPMLPGGRYVKGSARIRVKVGDKAKGRAIPDSVALLVASVPFDQRKSTLLACANRKPGEKDCIPPIFAQATVDTGIDGADTVSLRVPLNLASDIRKACGGSAKEMPEEAAVLDYMAENGKLPE